jgi:hypothetical protein
MSLRCLILFAWMAIGLTCPVYADTEDSAPPSARFVKLKSRAIGCGSVDGMVRMALTYATQGPDAARAIMAAEDCQIFETFSGRIMEETQGGICVLGLVRSRCLWFPTVAFMPADH